MAAISFVGPSSSKLEFAATFVWPKPPASGNRSFSMPPTATERSITVPWPTKFSSRKLPAACQPIPPPHNWRDSTFREIDCLGKECSASSARPRRWRDCDSLVCLAVGPHFQGGHPQLRCVSYESRRDSATVAASPQKGLPRGDSPRAPKSSTPFFRLPMSLA